MAGKLCREISVLRNSNPAKSQFGQLRKSAKPSVASAQT